MKNLKNGEALISQAVDFYFKCCNGTSIIPEQPNLSDCQIGRKYIYLNNVNGCIAKIRFSSTHLCFFLSDPITGEKKITGEIINPEVNHPSVKNTLSKTKRLIEQCEKLESIYDRNIKLTGKLDFFEKPKKKASKL